MKRNLLFTIIGLIAGTTLTATAAYVYTARDINYQPSDENWNVENVQEAISELKTDVNTISNKVSAVERIYKAGETELVALVSDDSFYTDNNGKYILANSNTGRTLLADTSIYKSLPATQDCIGIFESDTVSSFAGGVENILPSLGTSNSDYTLTTSGRVNYSNLEVDVSHVKVSVRATNGPSGQTYTGNATIKSNNSVDLTNYNTLLFSGDGYVTQHSGYSKPAYMQIWLENVEDSNDKIYLHNHTSDSNETITWNYKYVDISSANGRYVLCCNISEEDQATIDFINLTKLVLLNISNN